MITSNVHCHHPSTRDMTGPRTFVDSQCHINLGPVSPECMGAVPGPFRWFIINIVFRKLVQTRTLSTAGADWGRLFKDDCLDCNQSKFVNYPALLWEMNYVKAIWKKNANCPIIIFVKILEASYCRFCDSSPGCGALAWILRFPTIFDQKHKRHNLVGQYRDNTEFCCFSFLYHTNLDTCVLSQRQKDLLLIFTF